MIKKLRYYARFTVVCLLLNNRDIISTLKEELATLVTEYITMYRPPDAAEWQLVLQEVSSFTDVCHRASLRLPPGSHGLAAKPISNPLISTHLHRRRKSCTPSTPMEHIYPSPGDFSRVRLSRPPWTRMDRLQKCDCRRPFLLATLIIRYQSTCMMISAFPPCTAH